MKLLKKFLYRWVRRVNLRQRAKVWGDLEETELCLPEESIELLESQDDIPPFWKEVLLSISDANAKFLFHQTESKPDVPEQSRLNDFHARTDRILFA